MHNTVPRSILVVCALACAGIFSLALLNDAEAISPKLRKAPSGWVGPIQVKYTDFQNDAGIKYLATTTAPKTLVEDIFVDVDTAFAKAGLDGGPSAVTLSLGKAGAVTNYKGATTVFTGASNFGSGTFREEAPGVDINAYLLTTGTNASQLTAGRAKVYLKIAEPTDN